MKVLLIMPSYYRDAKFREVYRIYPPLGLAYLAAVAEPLGCEVKILDVMGRKKMIGSLIKEFKPDLIGVYCQTPAYTSFASTIIEIRKHFSGFLAAGGPHVHIPEEAMKTLKQLPVNCCCIGEGEATFKELLLALKSDKDLEDVDGICYKRNREIIVTKPRVPINELDKLPWPAWHLLELDEYESKSIQLNTSRGCPYRCVYCSSARIWGRNLRFRSAKNVVDEMKELNKRYGYRSFALADDTFVFNRKRLKEMADLLEGCNFELKVNGRINLMTDDLFKDLKRMGCSRIDYGIESGVQKVLNNIKKDYSVKQVEDVVRRTAQLGMKPGGYYMISLPGETLKDMKTTIKLAKRLRKKYGCTMDFQITRIYPGTELMLISGIKVDDWAKIRYPNLRYPNVPVYHELPFKKVYGLFVRLKYGNPYRNLVVKAMKKLPPLYSGLRYAKLKLGM